MGRYDWSVETDASIVSSNDSAVTLRVNCYFKNNDWDYSMFCTGWTSYDGGLAQVFGRANLDTRSAGKNGRVHVGSHDYVIGKSQGGHNVQYSARIMSDGGYANGDKWSANGSIWIPSLASHTVSYNANGGTGAPGNQTKWYGSILTLSSQVPTRTGYTFQGWSTGNDSSVEYNPGGQYGADVDVTLYAVWKINTYTVTFKDGYSGATVKTQTVEYGKSATAPTVTRTGYTFSGWDKSFSNVTANITVTATWKINVYTITFRSATGDGVSNMPGPIQKTHFQSVKLPTNIPTRQQYNFVGWATEMNGTARYQPGDTYAEEGNATLWATWELAASKITVYSQNGTAQSGLLHIYDSSGNLHFGIMYIYDSSGNRRNVV